MKSLVFLPSNTAHRPRKDQELIQAVARSHAAKAGRPRRGKRRSDVWTPQVSRANTPDQQGDGDGDGDGNNAAQPAPWARSVIQRGNSDPFQSFAVPITPRVNQLLSFYTRNILPIMYSTSMVPSVSNTAIVGFRVVEARDDYQSVLSVLQDQNNAVGFFLTQTIAMAGLSESQQLSREAIHLKARALTALQDQMKKSGEPDTAVIESMLLLLNAAVYAGDIAEARLHLKFVKKLLDERAVRRGPQSIGIVLLFRILYMDLAVSTTYTIQTVLDVDKWVPEMLNVALQPTRPKSNFRPPPIAGFLANMDGCLTEPLLTIFFECRRLLWVWWRQPARAVLESGPDVFTIDTHPETFTFRWLYSQLYVFSCRLANHIGSLQYASPDLERLARDAVACDNKELVQYIQRILSVAMLTLLAASCTKVLVAGHPLRPGSELLLERLESAIQPALVSLSRSNTGQDLSMLDQWPSLGRALLWCTFIGATVESVVGLGAVGKVSSINPKAAAPFSDHFGLIVRRLHLQDKGEITTLLKRFIYNEHMLTDVEVWINALRGDGGL